MGCSGVIATLAPGAGAAAVCAGAGAVAEAAGADASWFWALLLQPEMASAAPMASAIGVRKCLCMNASFDVAKRIAVRRKSGRLCQRRRGVARYPAGSHVDIVRGRRGSFAPQAPAYCSGIRHG